MAMQLRPWPSIISLRERELHVWSTNLDSVPDSALASLSSFERERLQRPGPARKRRRRAAARGVLRALLGHYLDVSPERVSLDVLPSGKPVLDTTGLDVLEPLQFSVSHSGGLALIAIARRLAVGVDVEVRRPTIDEGGGIARRTFGHAEARRIAALSGDARSSEFLRSWTRHEALLKCESGQGAARGDSPSPWVCSLCIDSTAHAAVAASAPPHEVRCLRWPVAEATSIPFPEQRRSLCTGPATDR
jgi:phosphopantetheinyl transferase